MTTTATREQPDAAQAILDSRIALAARDPHAFAAIYLRHHFTHAPAAFHRELFDALRDESATRLLVEGFRQSAKTTIATLAFPLWAAIFRPEKYPFIVIVGDTNTQAKLFIQSIKYELERNELLIADFGEQKKKEEWTKTSIVLNSGVLLLARSRGQKVRGFKFRQFRPTLVIVDDPEDTKWVKRKENRDDTERWFRNEVIPSTARGGADEYDARVILIGNLLHRDALLGRVQKYGTFRCLRFPAIDDEGNPTWQEVFPLEELRKIRDEVGETIFRREYLLQPVSDAGSIIQEERHIHYYEREPAPEEVRAVVCGVDLAISKRDGADYTAMVRVAVGHDGKKPVFWVLPEPVNAHLDFHETIATAETLERSNPGLLFFVEEVAYQKAAVEEMKRKGLAVYGVRPIGDKEARLRTLLPYFADGSVLFPRRGAGQLIEQLVGFGVEEYDDLVDALVHAIRGAIEFRLHEPLSIEVI